MIVLFVLIVLTYVTIISAEAAGTQSPSAKLFDLFAAPVPEDPVDLGMEFIRSPTMVDLEKVRLRSCYTGVCVLSPTCINRRSRTR